MTHFWIARDDECGDGMVYLFKSEPFHVSGEWTVEGAIFGYDYFYLGGDVDTFDEEVHGLAPGEGPVKVDLRRVSEEGE